MPHEGRHPEGVPTDDEGHRGVGVGRVAMHLLASGAAVVRPSRQHFHKVEGTEEGNHYSQLRERLVPVQLPL